MKTLVLALATAGLILTGSDAAQAGGGCRSGGFGYGGFGYGGYVQPSYGGFGYGGGWYGDFGGGHAHWHDTSHWDYIPPRVIRHCDHYHVQPGGWTFHRDGHWDYHD
jgi:hypothetical protein